jgi:hypothetical protein
MEGCMNGYQQCAMAQLLNHCVNWPEHALTAVSSTLICEYTLYFFYVSLVSVRVLVHPFQQ